jgi:bifunctional N-acetylglucosamine-1-phosphate-uridyltransferase/glucosamine-1-phosphate-acetyltransferase GlmU-like protein
MESEFVAIIMAGGLGTRMNSSIPKVVHKLNNLPLIVHILYKLKVFSKLKNLKQIFIVVGKYKKIIQEEIEKYIKIPFITYIDQLEPKGTGHAVNCCLDELEKYKDTNALILSGDVPLFSTISMLELTNDFDVARIVTTNLSDPSGYGRIIHDKGKFMKIVEHNDCSKKELGIKCVNCGIYVFKTKYLLKCLPYLNNNNFKKEYYLTDIFEIIKNYGYNIELFELSEDKQYEIIGINTIEQLNELELILKNKKIE